MQFAGHETFHIRDGWLHKGLSVVSKRPDIFLDHHATDTFGIGRNMVDALRYWLIASGMTVEGKIKKSDKSSAHRFTPLGKIINKKDRFIEEDLSLWALHYQLVTNIEKATAWYWFFNKMPVNRFDTQVCVNYLLRWVEQSEFKKKPNLSSLQKDVSCILRTYSKTNGRKRTEGSPEDSFECPFASLGLVEYLENSDSYKLNTGKRIIPVHSFAFAISRFASLTKATKNEIGFQELLSAEFSPGRAFLFSAEGLLENIERLVEALPKYFYFSKTAGLNTLKIKQQFEPAAILEAGFEGK